MFWIYIILAFLIAIYSGIKTNTYTKDDPNFKAYWPLFLPVVSGIASFILAPYVLLYFMDGWSYDDPELKEPYSPFKKIDTDRGLWDIIW